MDRNLERVVKWCTKEGIPPERVPSAWECLQLARFPSGLDYYVLDAALFYSPAIAFNWLRHSFGVGTLCANIEDVAAFVEGGIETQLVLDRMDFMRRRRVRMHPDWTSRREALLNRVIRVKQRATKLVEESEREKDRNGGAGTAAVQQRVG